MTLKNPYTIGFGKIPSEIISRNTVIDSIYEAFTEDKPDEQAFKITGMRGTGKTVTLTAIGKKFREDKDFIVLDLNCTDNILTDLAAELYSEVPSLTKYIDANLNLSAFGIGINLSRRSPVASINSAVKNLLQEIKKQKKRLLILMDEVRRTPGLVDLIQSFQIFIRNELPVFMVIAGLYEDIESIENSDGITFFLRATKYEMTPLNISYIKDSYKKNLDITDDEAKELALMTKGYAFAYQVLGKYMWDSPKRELTGQVLKQFDDMLSDKVYRKIWSELAEKDRFFLRFIAKRDSILVKELLEESGQSHSAWSVPRKRLSDKGIIDVSMRGNITLKLPRFESFIETQLLSDSF